jgi:hypothetical protein
MASLDPTDAITVAKRIRDWNGGGIMGHMTLLYQMSGKPGVDPYGWRAQRIESAIETALALKLIELYPSVGGTTYRAREIA